LRVKRASYAAADAVVAVSAFTLAALHAQGVRPKRACVIHNGAAAERFSPFSPEDLERAKARWSVSGETLLTVGHLSRRKAQDLVIRALPSLLVKFPRLTYLLAGQPTLAGEYSRLAA